MIRREAAPMNLGELGAAAASVQATRGRLAERLPLLDDAIERVRVLLGEAEDRLRDAGTEVNRAMTATGRAISSGSHHDRPRVLWTSGKGTVQLSGPRPADSPEGKLDHARRVYDAVEAEVMPIRGALARLERERDETRRLIGLAGAEIEDLERQAGAIRAAEAERSALTGGAGFGERLAAILRSPRGVA